MPAKKYRVKLTEDERVRLKELVFTGKAMAYKRIHAQVLLSADEISEAGRSHDEDIAKSLQIGTATVGRIRQRFVEQGLDAALERKPQENRRAKKLDGEREAFLIATACSPAPEGRKSWTLQLLVNSLIDGGIVETISDETVRQTLKKTNLNLG
jgi:transposase